MIRTPLLVLKMLLLWLLVAVGGCGDDDAPTDAGSGDAAFDAARDAGGRDGGRPCTTAEECDDGVSCTVDSCDPAGFCRNPVDLAMCDDGVFCNGTEQCDPFVGCVPSMTVETCNDSDVCTIDQCDEENKTCLHPVRDFDEDGEADWHCEGGTDCDDTDPTRGMSVAELCGDTVDNDCDKATDEAGCGQPPHDMCEDALDVSAGGRFFISNLGARADYSLPCAMFGTGASDVAFVFTLEEPSSVTIEAEGPGFTGLALRTECTDRATELECRTGFPASVRTLRLEPGTYYGIVVDLSRGEIELDVRFGPAIPLPPHDVCAMPVDVSEGGTFTGSFVDVNDDIATSCGFGGAPDLVYQFTTTRAQNVSVSLSTETGDRLSFALQTTCGASGSELRCVRGSPAASTFYELPRGTYFIVVEDLSFREVDFRLDVTFAASSPPPAGETCDNPIDLPLDTVTLGSLADKQDDIETTCGFDYREMVYRFTLASRRDVTVLVDGGGTFMAASVRTSCTDVTGLRCVTGSPARARLRNLAAGTYFVVVESFRGTSFNITVETSAPRTPVAVTGNDGCAVAHVVPPTGGLFSGNTSTLLNDYTTAFCGGSALSPDATFSLALASRKTVIASTDGSSFDTVLHLHRDMCVSGAELVCDDDGAGAPASLITQTLDAGNYFFVVDGFSGSSSGDYMFEVIVTDP
jgi:hypothetical protein